MELTAMTSLDRASIVDALLDQWEVLATLCENFTDTQWNSKTALESWSVRDVVAHIIGTESLLAGLQPPKITTDTKELGHVRNKIAEFNERWVLGLREKSTSELLRNYYSIINQRRTMLLALSDEEFEAPAATPAGQATYGRFMRIRLFDCWIHEIDIRDALKISGNEGGKRGSLAFAEILSSLGFTIGKKAQAPQGSRIKFELSGPLAQEIFVSVDQRATLVDQFTTDPTTTILLDSGLFTRLCAGRTTSIAHPGEIKIAGDQHLGAAIVDSLNFVI
ncbi:MAG: maleylpyruvate isomerase N-terminal domain-containing protein [Mycobacteriaceae bacterium]